MSPGRRLAATVDHPTTTRHHRRTACLGSPEDHSDASHRLHVYSHVSFCGAGGDRGWPLHWRRPKPPASIVPGQPYVLGTRGQADVLNDPVVIPVASASDNGTAFGGRGDSRKR